MKRKFILLLILVIPKITLTQVGIGTNTPASSSILEISSTSKGFLAPRLTTSERDAMVNPANGLQIFNITTGCLNYFIDNTWFEKCGTQITSSIGELKCHEANLNGTITNGSSISNVTVNIPYTGAYSVSYGNQTISSTGVNGITANLSASTLFNGSGDLFFTLTGTPTSAGNAEFALSIAGESCTFKVPVLIDLASQYPSGTINCYGQGYTNIVEVTNPNTGKIWMDRNLGALNAATGLTDDSAYGDLYQWGRRSDGHQCRNSLTTSTLATSEQPLTSYFIKVNSSISLPPNNWLATPNDNLWQGVNGVNNPCPIGFRLPTETEFENERLSWNYNNHNGAFYSVLRLTLGGSRANSAGNLYSVTTNGRYWTSTIDGVYAKYMYITSSPSPDAYIFTNQRAHGVSVRCIKN
jgi:uncharacterized protein (TIGR02145 family)